MRVAMKGRKEVMLAGYLRASLLATSLVAIAPSWAADALDLDVLIAAARKEQPINVLDSTGKITDMAKAFSAKYGVKAVGQKAKVTAQIEMMIREAQAGNVQGD